MTQREPDSPQDVDVGLVSPESEYSNSSAIVACACGCGRDAIRAKRHGRFERRFATDACRARARNREIARRLSVAFPPHRPQLHRQLCRACMAILGLLGDLEPHSRHELAEVGGARYSARVGELRAAGHRVRGPIRVLGAKTAAGPRVVLLEAEPAGPGGLEMYRLEVAE